MANNQVMDTVDTVDTWKSNQVAQQLQQLSPQLKLLAITTPCAMYQKLRTYLAIIFIRCNVFQSARSLKLLLELGQSRPTAGKA